MLSWILYNLWAKSHLSSVGDYGDEGNHIAIITYWTTFDEHERSHADEDFKNEFCKLLEFCEDTKELGYKLMWQGEQELDNLYKETVEGC